MADNERTPLIAVVRTQTPPPRYPHQTLRRICTIILAIVPVIVIAAILLATFLPFPFGHGDDQDFISTIPDFSKIPKSWPGSHGISYEVLQEILLNTPSAEKAREWSEYYTSGPHLAGKNLSQAIWTKEKWIEFGIKDTKIVDYDIYVNYPLGHRLALLEKTEEKEDTGVELDSWTVKYEASLEEDVLDEDGTSGLPDRIPTFHGYSASGNVTAQYVYCNYGTYKDFEELVASNISLSGRIALVKYGGIFRGLKVKRAQELGMVGVVIYSDPGDDGEITEKNGHATYPDGPARNPSSVQRGSTQFLSTCILSEERMATNS